MEVFLLSFTIVSLALLGLSVSVLAGRGGIRGSCGGLNNPNGAQGCAMCGRGSENETCQRKRTN